MKHWRLGENEAGPALTNLGAFVGHSNTVRYVGISPSMKRIVSACEDHSLRIWNAETYEAYCLCSGHCDFAVASEFVDENTVVSGAWDLRVMIWKIPKEFP